MCVALIINRVVKLSLGEFRVQHLLFLGPWLFLFPHCREATGMGNGLGDKALGESFEKWGVSSGTAGTLAGK